MVVVRLPELKVKYRFLVKRRWS